MSYQLADYGAMIGDRVRVEAYAEALRRTLEPGMTVADLGAGTGIFSLLACRFGAGRVYAIEPSPAVEVGRRLAAANGYGDRIRFIDRLSTETELPERVDLVVSDLRGVLPCHGTHLLAIVDARERLLAPRGRLVPMRDRLWAAVVSDAEVWESCTAPWGGHDAGFDLTPARELLAQTFVRRRVLPHQILLPGRAWATIDYPTVTEPSLAGELEWRVDRAGTGHGLAVWFDCLLTGGVGFSNRPEAPELAYGSAFFPWPRPVPLRPGDRVRVGLAADLVGEHYVWRWRTRVETGPLGATVRESFGQSTFGGEIWSPDSLRRREASHVPGLGRHGEIELAALESLRASSSLGEIAEALCRRFPGRFRSREAALAWVGELAERCR